MSYIVLIIVSSVTDNSHAFGLPGYREGITNLRKIANDLGEQNEVLAQAVNELEAEIDVMQMIEEQLSEIARDQGVTIKDIQLLVRENEDILSKQKENLKVSSFNSVVFFIATLNTT
jgi:cell division protein FtsB